MKRFACLVLCLAACTVGDDDTDDPNDPGDADTGSVESFATTIDQASIAQVNPFYGGQHSDLDDASPVTYATAHKLANYIAKDWPRLSVIGMEEIVDQQNADDLATILTDRTGHPWSVQRFGRGSEAGALPSTQEAIFWRTDLWTPVENFGTVEVEKIDVKGKGQDVFSVRVGGMLLHRNGTTHDLAMVTGKLTWLSRTTHGVPVGPTHLADEATKLMTWIDGKVAARPHGTRVIAVDTNTNYGPPAWDRFHEHYDDDGDNRPTHWTYGARRIDGLLTSYAGGARAASGAGFVGGPYRSASFGSDHRAIAARLKLR